MSIYTTFFINTFIQQGHIQFIKSDSKELK